MTVSGVQRTFARRVGRQVVGQSGCSSRSLAKAAFSGRRLLRTGTSVEMSGGRSRRPRESQASVPTFLSIAELAAFTARPSAELPYQFEPPDSKNRQLFDYHLKLKGRISRRGTCHNNANAKSFFQLLKHERIKIYPEWQEARRDVFDYIEMFYTPQTEAQPRNWHVSDRLRKAVLHEARSSLEILE
jgi:transposase InsO family protein